jgi:hypothetical protein
MKKKQDKKIGFLLTFLLIAGIFLIYANLKFNPTGLVVAPIEGINNAEDCATEQGYWYGYDSVCYNEQPVCDVGFLELCEDQTSCAGANGYWYGDLCNEEAECDLENVCNEGSICEEGICIIELVCGDGILNQETEECDGEDFGNDINGCADIEGFDGGELTCSETCEINTSLCTICGDGIINGDEECDDMNEDETDTCNNCILTTCGDGIVQNPNGNNVSEVCDDGTNDGSYDSCSTDCLTRMSYCGDGTCDSEEDCDSCSDDCGCASGYTCNSGTCEVETSDSSDDDNDEEIPTTTVITTNTVQKESSCTPNWECGEWTECVNEMQERVCTDVNQCDLSEGMPVTSQSCVVEVVETCFDGIKNQGEQGIDCGGPCEKKCSVFTIMGSAISGPIDAGKDFVLTGMFGSKGKTIISVSILVLVAGMVVVFVLFKKGILNFPLKKNVPSKKEGGI